MKHQILVKRNSQLCLFAIPGMEWVEERLLAVESMDETTAEALYHTIRKKLQQCGIEYSNMHGQFYDGAKVTCLESIPDCKHKSKRFPHQQFTPIAMFMF